MAWNQCYFPHGIIRIGMPDIFTKAKRSEVMAKIRFKDTKVEKAAFRYLRQRGIYFQKHYDKVAGSPDIALPRKKKAVFIDGDFWHGKHIGRLMGKEYWQDKILSNMERDKAVNNRLEENGWKYKRVWESDIMKKSSASRTLKSIADFLIE